MKLYTAIFIFGMSCLSLQHVSAQSRRQFLIKFDAVQAVQKQVLAGLEWRISGKSGLELQFGYQKYNDLPAGYTNGVWTNEYAERRSYELNSGKRMNDTGWQYLGTGRPMPDGPLFAIYPAQTVGISTGYIYSMSAGRNWRVIISPALFIAGYKHIIFSQKSALVNSDKHVWQLSENAGERQYIEETNFYDQVRMIESAVKWMAGGVYGAGIAWQSQLGLMLELRGNLGINFAEAPFSGPLPPPLVQNLYFRGQLLAGWAF